MEARLASDPLPAGRPTILVADPSEAVRNSVGAFLRAHDYTVETCASGRALLEAVRSRPPDCLVMEMDLPGITGLDLLARLADLEVPLPVIVLSTESDPHVAARVVEAGVLDLLGKPFSGRALLAGIERALRSHAPANPHRE